MSPLAALLASPALAGALAAAPGALPAGVGTVAVLVCPVDDTCDADAAWTAEVLPDDPVVPLDLLFERDNGGWSGGVDTRAALADAVARAEAAAAKERWPAVEAALADAKAALAAVRGDVNTQTLFTLFFLDGVAAVARGTDRAHEYSFRRAAALADLDGVDIPPHPEAAARAWADERRKLAVGGTGTVTLAGPADTRWSIDGVPLGNGVTERALLPGNHRLVATRPGSVRSWQAEVPVLAGRSVAVTARFDDTTSSRWLQRQLELSFDTLQGPPALTAVLADWARRHDLDAVRLVRVETGAPAAPAPPPALSRPDPLRPAAADGERVDHGDGIPSTYAEEIVAVDEAGRVPTAAERRLRVVWFDPALERFTLDAASVPRADTTPARFRVGLHLGYAGMMAHHHAAADLAGAFRVGPVEIEGRLGLVRADAPYNLYAAWVDQQLYHVAVAARWAPEWPVAPFVAAGPELYVPVAVGGRVATGAQVRIERRWLAVAEVHGGWLDRGPGWGIGLGVSRTY